MRTPQVTIVNPTGSKLELVDGSIICSAYAGRLLPIRKVSQITGIPVETLRTICTVID